jgi:hypothetical protein
MHAKKSVRLFADLPGIDGASAFGALRESTPAGGEKQYSNQWSGVHCGNNSGFAVIGSAACAAMLFLPSHAQPS